MAFQRGDIVSLDFEMPHSGDYVKHPAVILSGRKFITDRCYVCVMMTTSPLDDIFTFAILCVFNFYKFRGDKEYCKYGKYRKLKSLF